MAAAKSAVMTLPPTGGAGVGDGGAGVGAGGGDAYQQATATTLATVASAKKTPELLGRWDWKVTTNTSIAGSKCSKKIEWPSIDGKIFRP